MQTFQNRLSILIDTLGITKTKLAESLHVSPAFVSMLCSGKSSPSDRTISDICREFGVNEHWLRTGEGDMMQKLSRNQEIVEFMGRVMNDPDDAPRKRFISIVSKLDVDEWEMLDKIAKKMSQGE